ncbi:hypothetical protein GN956_G11558 [Arapaima gigas]
MLEFIPAIFWSSRVFLSRDSRNTAASAPAAGLLHLTVGGGYEGRPRTYGLSRRKASEENVGRRSAAEAEALISCIPVEENGVKTRVKLISTVRQEDRMTVKPDPPVSLGRQQTSLFWSFTDPHKRPGVNFANTYCGHPHPQRGNDCHVTPPGCPPPARQQPLQSDESYANNITME